LLEPGQESAVRLTIKLRDVNPRNRDVDPRPFDVGVTPVVEEGETTREYRGWVLQGRIRRVVKFDTAMIDLGRPSVLQQPIAPVKATMKLHEAVYHFAFRSTSPLVEAECKPKEGSVGTYDLTIKPNARLPVGAVSFKIVVDPVSKEGETLPTYELPGQVTVLTDVQPCLPEFLMGSHVVGATVEEYLTFSSMTGKPFKVLSVESANAEVTITKIDGGKEPPHYRVQCKVVKEGDLRAEIKCKVRDAEKQEYTVVVPMVVQGIAR
jgi:hypothetical protein